ncbi:hypothetical protein RZE82_08805 [Mollicutes bacterium LVI A0039]|nr:hypothetical protein RZE82_08805 [Mollicutes bacterium LVI A0039]
MKNNQFNKFVGQYGYEYDQAMPYNSCVQIKKIHGYKIKFNQDLSNKLFKGLEHPLISKYANFTQPSFDSLMFNNVVFHVISGNYNAAGFRSYTYLSRERNTADTYEVIMIARDTPLTKLPDNTFYENGYLVHYTHGYLNVNNIHQTIDKLRYVA